MHKYYSQRNVSEAANNLVLCSAECSSFTLMCTPIKVRAFRSIYLGKSFTWGDSDVSLHIDSEIPCGCHSRAYPLFPFLLTMWWFHWSCLPIPGLLCSFECQKGVPRKFLTALSILFPLLLVHFQFNNKNNILN